MVSSRLRDIRSESDSFRDLYFKSSSQKIWNSSCTWSLENVKMGLTGTPAVVKYLMFIFNLIFLITGIVVLSVGAVIKTAYYNYEDFLDDSFFSVPSLLIAIGAIVIIVSFFGCCGSVKENHCMVITFSVFLIFIFILELSAGIAGYVLKNNAEQFIVDKLNETMNKYNNSTEITKAWDELQTEMTCCGIHSASDWSPKAPTTLPTNVSEAPTLNLPMSCCSPVNGMWGSVNCTEDSPNLYKVGCLNKLGLFAKEHAVTLGGVGIGIAFLQMLGIVFSCCLAQAIRKQYESV